MSLDTTVWTLDDVDAECVFMRCRDLLHARLPTHPYVARRTHYDEEVHVLENLPAGLPARLTVHYRGDGRMLVPEAEVDLPECWQRIAFSTDFDPTEPDAGNLHAQIVCQLGEGFDAVGVRWGWRSSGVDLENRHFEGEDRYLGLARLLSGPVTA